MAVDKDVQLGTHRSFSPRSVAVSPHPNSLTLTTTTTLVTVPRSLPVPAPTNFTDLIKRLQHHLGSDRGLLDVDVNVLLADLASYKSIVGEWEKFALFDGSRYTRNLVDDGNGKYNLLIVAWGPGQKSPIHDHANSHCLMKILDGELVETQYTWPSSDTLDADATAKDHEEGGHTGHGLKVTAESTLKKDEVTYIHDNIGLHRVTNPSSTRPAVSLHLYTPPISLCHTFCEKTGGRRAASCAIFHSKAGKSECGLLKRYREVVGRFTGKAEKK